MYESNSPDILEDLLFESKGLPFAGQNELDKLIRCMTVEDDEEKQVVQSISLLGKKPEKSKKKKTTHYISREVFEELGEAKEKISGMLPKGLHLRITKSSIVDSALRMLLKELDEKGEASILVKLLMKEK